MVVSSCCSPIHMGLEISQLQRDIRTVCVVCIENDTL